MWCLLQDLEIYSPFFYLRITETVFYIYFDLDQSVHLYVAVVWILPGFPETIQILVLGCMWDDAWVGIGEKFFESYEDLKILVSMDL